MATLSELIIGHPEISSFADLEDIIARIAGAGEIHLYLDIRPEYVDTPRDWQQRLEIVFYRAERRTE